MKTLRVQLVGLASLVCLCGTHSANAGIMTFGSGVNQFSMDFVPIGSPGNAADNTGSPIPAGAVGYNFQMGKYEVSEDMINKYNAAFGTANSLVITKDTRGVNKPVTGVSWNEAARFVNWLNTSSGGFAAYNTTGGVNSNISLWTVADTLDFDPLNPFRSKRTTYVLPTINEWYKAAYFDPNANVYYDYPTGSNLVPDGIDFAGDSVFEAVFFQGAANAQPNDITNVGVLSPFGTAGQGGNVFEWNETESDLVNNLGSSARVGRGGFWFSVDSVLSSSSRFAGDPAIEDNSIGFRVASLSSTAVVPEPGSLAIWGLMCVGGWLCRGRRVRK